MPADDDPSGSDVAGIVASTIPRMGWLIVILVVLAIAALLLYIFGRR